MNKMLHTVLLAAVLAGLFMAGASTLTGCSLSCDVGKYKDTVMPLVQEWDDAVKLANNTPRMTLPAQIEEMQRIRRDMGGLKIQSCLEDAHGNLLKSMDLQIDGFLSFLKQDPEAVVQSYFTRSDAAVRAWTNALAEK